MHGENKTKNRAAMALALCFAVIALTSFLAVKASIDKITEYGSTATDSDTPVAESQDADADTPVVDSQNGKTVPAEDGGTSENTAQASGFIPPADGSIILKYSMDSLVYSKTLDQYMTHSGVDIAADKSTEVKAVADGTVSRVYSDDRYGVTVCVTHDDGLVSIYSNLSEHGLAETGDEVKQGQTIGSVGDTALFESLDESHLHFAMTKDGNCCDPGEYISSLKAEQ